MFLIQKVDPGFACHTATRINPVGFIRRGAVVQDASSWRAKTSEASPVTTGAPIATREHKYPGIVRHTAAKAGADRQS